MSPSQRSRYFHKGVCTMYSVVLATMLAAGGQTADTWRHGCHGCWGGYSCYGCSGCYGCYGGYSSHVEPVVVYGYANGGRDFITNGHHGYSAPAYAGGVIVQQAPAVAVVPGGGVAPAPEVTPAN